MTKTINPEITEIKPKDEQTISDKEKTTEQLILDNENFVYSIVNNEFKKYPYNVKEELYSAGKMGLVIAAQKFNPSNYDNKFISYAVHWIRYYVNEEIRKMYPVKLNQNYVYKRNKMNKFIDTYKKDHRGKNPTDKCIGKALGMSQKVIDNIRKVNGGDNFSFVSFQAITNTGSTDKSDDMNISDKLVNDYLNTASTTDDYTQI